MPKCLKEFSFTTPGATPCFGADYFLTRSTVSQHQSRKHFLAKALGLAVAAVALPRAFVNRVEAQPAVPAVDAVPVKLAVESRAVARRNASL